MPAYRPTAWAAALSCVNAVADYRPSSVRLLKMHWYELVQYVLSVCSNTLRQFIVCCLTIFLTMAN